MEENERPCDHFMVNLKNSSKHAYVFYTLPRLLEEPFQRCLVWIYEYASRNIYSTKYTILILQLKYTNILYMPLFELCPVA